VATAPAEAVHQDDFTKMLAAIQTESGKDLLSLTAESPVLLVFLRHFGCSFCRKAISDIAELSPELAARGVRPVFVHLGTPEIAKAHFDFYKIPEVERIHDPDAQIYRHPAFGLGRSSPWLTLVNPFVVVGWLKGAVFKHGIGKIQGDGHQMPGIFLLKGAKIERKFIYRQISDEPPYLKLIS
jgi:thiol-disulfide isomerase/thioredoxin